MPRISYALNGSVGEWYEVSPEHKDQLILRFHPSRDGYIIVDNTVYRVKCGEVRLPMSRIRDSKYAPRLECDDGGYTLEGFEKSGADITPLPTKDSAIRALIHRCRKNEERIAILESKLSSIIERTDGHRIFK